MGRSTFPFLLALASVATGCGHAGATDEAIAAKVEHAVVAARPDIQLSGFARFYAREDDGSVSALYVRSPKGHEPLPSRAGTTTWTSPDRMPIVSGGGCSVLTIRYDAVREALQSVACNGDI